MRSAEEMSSSSDELSLLSLRRLEVGLELEELPEPDDAFKDCESSESIEERFASLLPWLLLAERELELGMLEPLELWAWRRL